jgi:hypothetical protein
MTVDRARSAASRGKSSPSARRWPPVASGFRPVRTGRTENRTPFGRPEPNGSRPRPSPPVSSGPGPSESRLRVAGSRPGPDRRDMTRDRVRSRAADRGLGASRPVSPDRRDRRRVFVRRVLDPSGFVERVAGCRPGRTGRTETGPRSAGSGPERVRRAGCRPGRTGRTEKRTAFGGLWTRAGSSSASRGVVRGGPGGPRTGLRSARSDPNAPAGAAESLGSPG